MQIPYDKLIDLLQKHASWDENDAAPNEALYISFPKTNEVDKKSPLILESSEATVVIDRDKDDNVLGIELVK